MARICSANGDGLTAPADQALSTATDSTPALIGSRFSAFVADLAILLAVQWLVVFAVSRLGMAIGLASQRPCGEAEALVCQRPGSLLGVILGLWLVVSTVAYHAWFESGSAGATPGKQFVGIKVISLGGHDVVPYGQAVLRSCARQLFLLGSLFSLDVSPLRLPLSTTATVPLDLVVFLALPLLGVVILGWGAFERQGRGLHDRIAETMVVEVERHNAAHHDSSGGASGVASVDQSAADGKSSDKAEAAGLLGDDSGRLGAEGEIVVGETVVGGPVEAEDDQSDPKPSKGHVSSLLDESE